MDEFNFRQNMLLILINAVIYSSHIIELQVNNNIYDVYNANLLVYHHILFMFAGLTMSILRRFKSVNVFLILKFAVVIWLMGFYFMANYKDSDIDVFSVLDLLSGITFWGIFPIMIPAPTSVFIRIFYLCIPYLICLIFLLQVANQNLEDSHFQLEIYRLQPIISFPLILAFCLSFTENKQFSKKFFDLKWINILLWIASLILFQPVALYGNIALTYHSIDSENLRIYLMFGNLFGGFLCAIFYNFEILKIFADFVSGFLLCIVVGVGGMKNKSSLNEVFFIYGLLMSYIWAGMIMKVARDELMHIIVFFMSSIIGTAYTLLGLINDDIEIFVLIAAIMFFIINIPATLLNR
jgi:hypothetical protein